MVHFQLTTRCCCAWLPPKLLTLPQPTTAAVLPWMSNPSRPSSEKLVRWVRAAARDIFLLSAISRAMACSATAYGLCVPSSSSSSSEACFRR